MNKMHALAVAIILAVSAGFGLVAAARTAGLHSASGSAAVSSPAISARAQKLDRVEASLRRALRDRPPALPAVPSSRPAAAAAPRVVFHRPAPIIVVKHHSSSDGEHETAQHEGESDD